MDAIVASSPPPSASRRFDRWKPLAMGAASGLLLTLAYPPLRWGWLAWAALVPLYLTIARGEVKGATVAGWAFGFLLFLVGANWMTELGSLPWVVLSLIQSTPFLSLALVLSLLLPRLPAWARPLAFASFWVGQEWIRSFGPYAFPWFILAATQVKILPLVQIVALTGQWGLSFAVALVNGLLGEAWLARAARKPFVRPLVWAGVVPAAMSVHGLAAMVGVLASSPKPHETDRFVRVGVAQGSFVKSSSYMLDARDEVLDIYTDLTRQAVREGGPETDVVLWPETVVPDYLLRTGYALPLLQNLARSLPVSLLVGTMDEDAAGSHYNSVVLLDRAGGVRGKYDKQRIVPIGEFFPLRGLLGNIYEQYGVPPYDLVSGKGAGLLTIEGVKTPARVGVLICYESAFVNSASDCARGGAEYLALITSDLTFGTTAGPIQHADLAILRAVETRRWVVRAAATGTSQFISASGVVTKSLPLMARDTLTARVPLRDDITPFVRYGDWFLVLVGVLSVGALALAGRPRRAPPLTDAPPPPSNLR